MSCAVAPRHPFTIEPGFENAPNIDRVFLAPMNAFGGITDELRDGTKRTHVEVKSYLERHGMKILSMPLFEFRQASSVKPIEDNTAEGDPKVRALFASLRSRGDFDLLIMPAVVARSAKLSGRSARWDGVRRPMESSKKGMTWDGNTRAASLLVMAYDERGVLVFESHGGLDHIFRADVHAEQMVVVDDPLSNIKALREGIAIAFHPFLPIPE